MNDNILSIIDANKLEEIAKRHPDECFLKGTGVLKLTQAIRMLERQLADHNAEILTLHRQLAGETLRANQGWDRWDGANKRANTAEAKIAEEKQDAERYRWLRNDDAQYVATVRIYQSHVDLWSSLTQSELDMAIDTAMQAEEPT